MWQNSYTQVTIKETAMCLIMQPTYFVQIKFIINFVFLSNNDRLSSIRIGASLHCSVSLFYCVPFGDYISMLKEFCTCQHIKNALNASTFQKVDLQIHTIKLIQYATINMITINFDGSSVWFTAYWDWDFGIRRLSCINAPQALMLLHLRHTSYTYSTHLEF